jgi:hypothetical protein
MLFDLILIAAVVPIVRKIESSKDKILKVRVTVSSPLMRWTVVFTSLCCHANVLETAQIFLDVPIVVVRYLKQRCQDRLDVRVFGSPLSEVSQSQRFVIAPCPRRCSRKRKTKMASQRRMKRCMRTRNETGARPISRLLCVLSHDSGDPSCRCHTIVFPPGQAQGFPKIVEAVLLSSSEVRWPVVRHHFVPGHTVHVGLSRHAVHSIHEE